ncbi:hypothetical protein POJ06DRAFT_267748 [Lipomyces tetrasporus]|uniref:Mid2 domain-containing protein n=1 Tax=Lipomyces tetrasporus TaxID=54092 RepID=A0AAD7QV89_9ASCO|nr:uncharacterized protein POJ06DRAFT_267748 [Lipomyces tetrasporus]KAJ8101601.1 hypothetical protein POJ06DRAFT_267748 [Lipomyces tetrasporus]
MASQTSTSRGAASSSAVTPAVTSEFIAPWVCAEKRLTMHEDQNYEVWLNEPLPVSMSTASSCHPSEFISSYLDISTIIATLYNNSVIAGTSTIAYSSGGQAYGHVIDGYVPASTTAAPGLTSSSATVVTSATASVPAGLASSVPSSTKSGKSSHLSGGTIAGIVVGCVVVAILVLLLAWFFIRRRRIRAPPAEALPTSPYLETSQIMALPVAPPKKSNAVEAPASVSAVYEAPGSSL